MIIWSGHHCHHLLGPNLSVCILCYWIWSWTGRCPTCKERECSSWKWGTEHLQELQMRRWEDEKMTQMRFDLNHSVTVISRGKCLNSLFWALNRWLKE
jgi:hypothetical protein